MLLLVEVPAAAVQEQMNIWRKVNICTHIHTPACALADTQAHTFR